MIINSERIGNGQKTIVILHGLYGSSDSWIRVANLLGSDYTIHLLDQRNHGKSFHDSSHSYLDLCDDLRTWADAQQLQQFNLLGHSMGGKAAMFFAAKYPEMVIKLIIADISPRNYTALLDNVESTQFHLNLIMLMKTIPVAELTSFRQASEYLKDYDEIVRNVILKNLKKENSQLAWKINLNALFENLPEIMNGLNPDDFIDKKISTPTIFLKAENSNYINSNDIKLIDFIFSNAKIEIIANAGHWLHYEKPEAVATAVNKFLS
jgi:pimeloyl-ACP methyl ester carboxylesterase